MLNIPTTTIEIAALNKDRLSSLTKGNLIDCCKILGLKRYSKQKKDELVERVFEASDVDRQILLNKDMSIANKHLAKSKEQAQRITSRRQEENVITATKINGLERQLNGDTMQIASVLHRICCKLYAPTTVAKNMTRKLKAVLPTTQLTLIQQSDLKSAWDKLVYAEHYAIKERELLLNKDYARDAIKP
ncbi:MAG: hypothetical protein HC764_21100 [Pleurocapsa sp. CRU_1_2]|nr:hypothetical protein [Pleurocapsa sp. CRU_1_2]